MTSFNWKKFAHLNISPQTNGKMKNRVRQWKAGGRKGKARQNQRQNGSPGERQRVTGLREYGKEGGHKGKLFSKKS